MIVAKIYGGLGNQFFQYAMGRSLSLYHNVELVLDTSWYQNVPEDCTPRKFYLNEYNIVTKKPTAYERLKLYPCRWRFYKYISIPFFSFDYIKESSFSSFNSSNRFVRNVYLDGYWQKLEYFYQYASIIRDELTLKEPILQNAIYLADYINKSDSVSIHVRRGDYVSNSNAMNVHGLCDIDYYKRSVAFLEKKFMGLVYFIFSDDVVWARENLSFIRNAVFVENDGDRTTYDVRLMSMCKHHIIANSTFSWWGAWLNDNKNKIVIAPDKWFIDNRNVDGLFPSHWLKM